MPDKLIHGPLKLGNARVPQAFAADHTLGMLFTVQLKAEPTADRRGDLLITRVRLQDGKRLGTMTLRGFGHGIALGCIPAPDSTQTPKGSWLWIETGPTKLAKGGSGISARGTRSTRLMFVPGRTVTCKAGKISARNAAGRPPKSFAARILAPTKGKPVAVTVDATNRRLAYKDGGTYSIYQLDDHGLPGAKPIRMVRAVQPGTFQGFALAGPDLLILRGAAGIQPTIHRVDWATGKTTLLRTTATVGRRGYFEAEGIHVTPTGEIWWGLSTGRAGARRLSIYRHQ